MERKEAVEVEGETAMDLYMTFVDPAGSLNFTTSR
jgi:hypothetical protein